MKIRKEDDKGQKKKKSKRMKISESKNEDGIIRL